jgi:hypothetical protein
MNEYGLDDADEVIVVTFPVVDNVTPVPAARLGAMFPVRVVQDTLTHEMLLMLQDEALKVLEFNVVPVMVDTLTVDVLITPRFPVEAFCVVTDNTVPVALVKDTLTHDTLLTFADEALTLLDVSVLMLAVDASNSTSDRTESSLICKEGVPEILNAPEMSLPST